MSSRDSAAPATMLAARWRFGCTTTLMSLMPPPRSFGSQTTSSRTIAGRRNITTEKMSGTCRWPPARAHSARLGAKPSTRRDVFFCGVAFPGRLRMLKDLSAVLDRAHTEVFGEGWDTDLLRFCKNDRLQPEQLPEYYASSAIVLNLGRDFHYANRKYQLAPSTPGPRTFEAAMAGACQFFFVDSLEILDYFHPDEEIVLFNDPTEFEARLTELLMDVVKRKQIGNAARTRCLSEHTYAALRGKSSSESASQSGGWRTKSQRIEEATIGFACCRWVERRRPSPAHRRRVGPCSRLPPCVVSSGIHKIGERSILAQLHLYQKESACHVLQVAGRAGGCSSSGA